MYAEILYTYPLHTQKEMRIHRKKFSLSSEPDSFKGTRNPWEEQISFFVIFKKIAVCLHGENAKRRK
jgi:hypothetical protein